MGALPQSPYPGTVEEGHAPDKGVGAEGMPVRGTTSAACATTTPARARHKGYPGAGWSRSLSPEMQRPRRPDRPWPRHPPWPDRQRTRAEDRIRAARATGLRNLPLHRTTQNRIWLEIVQIALDPPAWMPMLALTSKTRLAPPPAAPPVHHGRATRDHRPSAYPPPGPAPALEQPHHRRPRPAQPTPRTQSDQWMPRPFDSTSTPKAVESGAIPRRHSGLQPAQPQPMARKRSTDSLGGPSRNFEAHGVGLPHRVACRVLGVSESWFYKWVKDPVTKRQERRQQPGSLLAVEVLRRGHPAPLVGRGGKAPLPTCRPPVDYRGRRRIQRLPGPRLEERARRFRPRERSGDDRLSLPAEYFKVE